MDPLAAQRLRTEPGVAYAAEESHFAVVEARGGARSARLELTLVREDGASTYSKAFERPYRPRRS